MLLRGIMGLLLAALGAGYLNMKLAPSEAGNAYGAVDSQSAYASAEAVTSHHADAFIARDIDAVMSDYAENAVLITPDGVYSGAENVRARLQEAMQSGDQSEAPFSVTKTQIADPMVYVEWTWAMADGSMLYGSDTFIVEHGKIAKQTVAFYTKEAPAVDMMDDGGEMMDDANADDAASDS